MLDARNETLWITYLTANGAVALDGWPGGPENVNVPMRTIVRRALDLQAIGLILSHNHPSGDPRPSARDLAFTDNFVSTLKPLGIKVLDHYVTGNGQVTSFRENGWLTGHAGPPALSPPDVWEASEKMLNEWSDREPVKRRPIIMSGQFWAGVIVTLGTFGLVATFFVR